MQKFFHKSLIFDSPWASTHHIFSMLIPESDYDNTWVSTKLNTSKETKLIAGRQLKMWTQHIWSKSRLIQPLELWKKKHIYTAGDKRKRLKNFYLDSESKVTLKLE